jgi:hypothetical protein
MNAEGEKQIVEATSRLNDGLGTLTPDEVWWIREKREQKKESGAYWLTPEGRAQIRETWTDPEEAGCPVLPLLNALEALERA